MKRILIIEDDPLISKVYSSKYESAGFDTATAADGQEGLDKLKSFKPDLVHLDLTIPKVNGVDIIRHIRSQPETVSLPVVVLSNTYQNRLVKGALDAGASECVSKATSTPKMMLAVVEKYRARVTAAKEARKGESAASAAPERGPEAEPIDTTKIQRHAVLQGEIARGFLERARQKLTVLRERVAPLFRADETSRVADLSELCRVTESFAGQAAVAGFEEVSRASYALAALLRELVDDPSALTPSCLYTIIGASDFLSALLERTTAEPVAHQTPFVLVIDDDPLCRRALCSAMARLNVVTLSVDDPRIALRLLSENRFSLVFVDIEMPGMSGFEFCRELRNLPAHATTPVAFVTSAADEAARKKAMESGANDLIAKPFLPMELAVKALTLLR
jgi:DNA-binding response OmpR family regulator